MLLKNQMAMNKKRSVYDRWVGKLEGNNFKPFVWLIAITCVFCEIINYLSGGYFFTPIKLF